MIESIRLQAFSAICETGSFDKAAALLHITPSAVSQRMSALEREVGQVLIVRARPVRATAAGRVLLGFARQSALLYTDVLKQISPETEATTEGRVRMSVAINADSISTWFQPALAAIAAEGKFLMNLHVEDQDHTAQLLTEGSVMAAVATTGQPVPGCKVQPLGGMTYWTACAPHLISGRDEVTDVDLGTLPMLRFDLKDDLQHTMLRRLGITSEPPTHFIPSNHEFLTAARLGLGWGVLPRAQIQADIDSGGLIRLIPTETVVVELFWQCWRMQSPALQHLTDLVFNAAHEHLEPPRTLHRANPS
ncbi:LysR family transcriptional regulator ArgP [Rhodococcus sp. 311R]|uniref:LysR family transcriptional regulator ArgP n=1 Tax=Rhodococcus sp. 311R TaxID=1617904 RepID=UPI0009E21019|nr:LysR family transcriptional regulator ArgP [Rhodococcus sp. 311R]